jgi:hypothetical protein
MESLRGTFDQSAASAPILRHSGRDRHFLGQPHLHRRFRFMTNPPCGILFALGKIDANNLA